VQLKLLASSSLAIISIKVFTSTSLPRLKITCRLQTLSNTCSHSVKVVAPALRDDESIFIISLVRMYVLVFISVLFYDFAEII
jgi:hypothetical protein